MYWDESYIGTQWPFGYAISFFNWLFGKIIWLMTLPIDLGGNFNINLFMVFVGIALISLFITVVRHLLD